VASAEGDAGLIARFVSAVEGLSDREAGDEIGVSHTAIQNYRSGATTRLKAATRRAIEAFLGGLPEVSPAADYADQLEAAAAELSQMAEELREKARRARVGISSGRSPEVHALEMKDAAFPEAAPENAEEA